MHQLLSHVVHLKGGKIKNAQLQQSLVVQLIASLVSLTKIFRAQYPLLSMYTTITVITNTT